MDIDNYYFTVILSSINIIEISRTVVTSAEPMYDLIAIDAYIRMYVYIYARGVTQHEGKRKNGHARV